MKHDCRFAESREESVNSVTVICISILQCYRAKTFHEKSRLLNKEDRNHNIHTIKRALIVGVW